MPCDTIQLTQVQKEFEGRDKKLVKKALEKLGFSVSISVKDVLNFSNGTVQGTYDGKSIKTSSAYGRSLDLNKLKEAYSAQIVEQSAEEFGWILTPLGANENGEIQYNLEKPF